MGRKALIFVVSLVCSKPALGQEEKKKEPDVNVRVLNAPILVMGLFDERIPAGFDVMFSTGLPFNIGWTTNYYQSEEPPSYVEQEEGYTSMGYEDGDIETNSYRLDSFQTGLRLDYVLSRGGPMNSGFYFSNALTMGGYKSSLDQEVYHPSGSCSRSWETKGISYTGALMGGYQHYWASGLNANVGIGMVKSRPFSDNLTVDNGCKDKTWESSQDEIYSTGWLDFAVGYAW